MENVNRLTKLDCNFYLNILHRTKDNKQFNVYKSSMPYAERLIKELSK